MYIQIYVYIDMYIKRIYVYSKNKRNNKNK